MSCGCKGYSVALAGMEQNTSGMSGPPRFRNLERVLAQYITDCLKSETPFYISPDLNSDTLAYMRPYADDIPGMFKTSGIGFLAFLAPIISAIAGVASTVGTTAVAIAPAVGNIVGGVAAIKTINAVNNKTKTTNGVQVPTAIAPQAVAAIQQDVGGTGLTSGTLLLIAGGFAALMLLKR